MDPFLRPSPVIPEFVYTSFPTDLAPIALTVLDEHCDLQTNPTIDRDPCAAVSVKFINGGRFSFSNGQLDVASWVEGNYKIHSVSFKDGPTLSVGEILKDRDFLLRKFLDTLEGLDILGDISRQSGLAEGEYVYRAITTQEARDLNEGWNHRLTACNRMPTTNFESQSMFDSEGSQAKLYHSKDNYSGDIIRFKIADSRLYRIAGFSPPRVIPNFAHYLPGDIEVSKDGGQTFIPLNKK
jgi:hypothetical protein